MLMIRLSRVGKKKYPLYRIVIQEKARDPWGKSLEILGNYNPHSKELNIKKERIEHWLSVGAQMSPTINNLLISKEIIKGEKVKAAKLTKKKKKGEDKKEGEEKKEDKLKEEKPTEEKKEVEEKKEDKPKEEVKEEKTEEKKEEK